MVWTLGEMTGLYEQIEWFAAHGFTGVDFHAQPNFGLPWATFDPRDASEAEVARLARALESFSEVGIHGESFAYDIKLCSPNELVREASVESLRPSLELASSVGAKTVTYHIGKADAQWAHAQLREAFARSLDQLDGMAMQTGVTVGIENDVGFEDYIDLVLDAGPGIGMTLDTGHAAMADGACYRHFGSLGNLIRHVGDRLVHVHVHDYDGTNDHQAIGTGRVDWADLCTALREIHYCGMLCMEYNPSRTRPEDYIEGHRRLEEYLQA